MIRALRHPRRRRGAGALEFALTLPVLLIVSFGLAELGMLIHQLQIVSRVTRDGARIGAGVIEGVDATGDLITASAEQATLRGLANAGVDCDVLNCTIEAEWFEQNGWMMLEVSTSIPYQTLTLTMPFIPDRVEQDFVVLTQQQIIDDG